MSKLRLQVRSKTLDVGPMQTLLRQGENLADAVIIAMDRYYNGLDRAALAWRVRAYTEKETLADLWVPSILAENETVELLWEVTRDYTQAEGLIRIELIGAKDDVKTVINADKLRVWPDVANAYAPQDNSWQTALDRVQQGVADASQSALSAANSAAAAGKSAADAANQAKRVEEMSVSAQTLPPGSSATVEKSALGSSFHLRFGMPQGLQGPVGPQGAQGIQGPQGPRGIDGAAVSAEGIYAFNVDENGHLLLSYTGEDAPDFAVNDNGHLILTLEEGTNDANA